jgi:hypothetical protein
LVAGAEEVLFLESQLRSKRRSFSECPFEPPGHPPADHPEFKGAGIAQKEFEAD